MLAILPESGNQSEFTVAAFQRETEEAQVQQRSVALRAIDSIE